MQDDYDLTPEPAPAPPSRGAARGTVRTGQRAPTAPTATAAATAPARPTSAGGYVSGGLLVVKDGATLPERCIKCNAPAPGGRVKKRIAYNEDESGPGGARFIPLIGRFVVAFWALKRMATRQYVTVNYWVCSKHRTQRIAALLAMFIGVPLGLVLLGVGMANNQPPVIAAGGAVFLIGAVSSLGAAHLKYGTTMRDGVGLKGAGKEFMDSLPRPGVRLPRR